MINAVKFAYQRLVRGYDDRVTWDLPAYIYRMIIAHLKHQRDNGSGRPVGLTEKGWHKVLDKMIKGFELDDDWTNKKQMEKYQKARSEALVLFSIYYDSLWD